MTGVRVTTSAQLTCVCVGNVVRSLRYVLRCPRRNQSRTQISAKLSGEVEATSDSSFHEWISRPIGR